MRSDAAISSRVDFLACNIVTLPAASAATIPMEMKVTRSCARTERRYHVQSRSRDSDAAARTLPWRLPSRAGAASLPVLSGCSEVQTVTALVSRGTRACPVPLESGHALDLRWRMFLSANRYPLRRNMR
jgi:hypothetical protein